MIKTKTPGKLKKILKDLEQEEVKEQSPAESILKKIREREEADKEKRAVAEKFVDDFTKQNGPIKYFPDQWSGSPPWRDGYDEGYQQAQWESEEEHKDLIYALVKRLTRANY